ncbi:MAG: TolC family protein [Fibrobacterales bacterium]
MIYLRFKLITVLALSLLSIGTTANKPTYSLSEFIQKGLANDGRLEEKRFGKKLKEHKIDEIRMGAILPRFEFTAGWGPAPGLKSTYEETQFSDVSLDGVHYDSLSILESKTEYDILSFKKWGPAFVTEVKMVQPLNLFRYNSGMNAAKADRDYYNWNISSSELKKERELQEYYFGYLYAQDLHELSLEVESEMMKIEERIDEMLFDEDESVSQFDLLELKTNKYAIAEGVEESRLGVRRAKLAAAFSLGFASDTAFTFIDSLLVVRKEPVPSLDSLKIYLKHSHPDLQMLKHGLKAMNALKDLAQGELGPEIFLFASAEYAKSWAGDRRSLSDEAFSEDPLNKISGAIGIGLKYRLNIWSRYQNYSKKKLELTHLQRKESYAERGLGLLLDEQYGKFEKSRTLLSSARASLRAAEAWLKGAAMKYDVDPSEARGLIKAFKAKVGAKRNYLKSVYNYNIEVGRLFERSGWSIAKHNATLTVTGGPE